MAVYGQEKKIIILQPTTHARIFPVEVTDPDTTSQTADEGEKIIKPDRKEGWGDCRIRLCPGLYS